MFYRFKILKDRTAQAKCYLPALKIKVHNVMTHGQNFFDQQVNSNLRRCDNTQRNAFAPGDDYITGCLLDYNYVNN